MDFNKRNEKKVARPVVHEDGVDAVEGALEETSLDGPLSNLIHQLRSQLLARHITHHCIDLSRKK